MFHTQSTQPHIRPTHPPIAEARAKLLRLMPLGPLAAMDEVWLGPRLAIDGVRRNHRNRSARLRRKSRTRAIYVAIDASLRAEELLRAAGCRERCVLQKNFVHREPSVARVTRSPLAIRAAPREKRPSRTSCCQMLSPGRSQIRAAAESPPCNPRHIPCRSHRDPLHSGTIEAHRPALRAQSNMPPTHLRHYGINLSPVAQPGPILYEAPQLHRRSTTRSKAPSLSRPIAMHFAGN